MKTRSYTYSVFGDDCIREVLEYRRGFGREINHLHVELLTIIFDMVISSCSCSSSSSPSSSPSSLSTSPLSPSLSPVSESKDQDPKSRLTLCLVCSHWNKIITKTMPHLWVTLQFPLTPTFSSPVAMEILSRSRMRSISIKVFTTDSDGDNPEFRNEIEERRIMKTILSGPVREHIHRCEILEINAVYPQNLPNLTSLLVLASHERLTVFELNAVERYGSAPSISYSGFKPPIFRISPFPLLSELSLDGHNFLVLMSFNPIRWFEDSGAGSGSTSDRWRRLKIHTYAHQKWHEEKPLPLLRYMPFLCKFFEVCISNLQVEVPVGPLKRLIDEEGQVEYVPRLELDHVRKDEAVAALVKHLLPDELYIKGGALKSLPLELPSKVTFVDSAVRIQDIAYLRQLLVEYEDEEMQIEFLNSREDDVDVPTLHLLGVTRFEKIERGEEREVYWRYEMEDDWGLPEELGWETDSEGAVEVAGGSLEV